MDEGLAYGYNMRNLVVLETLDRLAKTLGLIESSHDLMDYPIQFLSGQGSHLNPYHIGNLPFAHTAYTHDPNTSTMQTTDRIPYHDVSIMQTTPQIERQIDRYGCAMDTNESGAEVVYQLDLVQPTAIRALVLDTGAVDIDLHLLSSLHVEDHIAQDCIARDHHMIEGTLSPRTYYFVLDTWVDREGIEKSGRYQFTILTCEEGDSACANPLQ